MQGTMIAPKTLRCFSGSNIITIRLPKNHCCIGKLIKDVRYLPDRTEHGQELVRESRRLSPFQICSLKSRFNVFL
jgi:hypothetical protein